MYHHQLLFVAVTLIVGSLGASLRSDDANDTRGGQALPEKQAASHPDKTTDDNKGPQKTPTKTHQSSSKMQLLQKQFEELQAIAAKNDAEIKELLKVVHDLFDDQKRKPAVVASAVPPDFLEDISQEHIDGENSSSEEHEQISTPHSEKISKEGVPSKNTNKKPLSENETSSSEEDTKTEKPRSDASSELIEDISQELFGSSEDSAEAGTTTLGATQTEQFSNSVTLAETSRANTILDHTVQFGSSNETATEVPEKSRSNDDDHSLTVTEHSIQNKEKNTGDHVKQSSSSLSSLGDTKTVTSSLHHPAVTVDKTLSTTEIPRGNNTPTKPVNDTSLTATTVTPQPPRRVANTEVHHIESLNETIVEPRGDTPLITVSGETNPATSAVTVGHDISTTTVEIPRIENEVTTVFSIGSVTTTKSEVSSASITSDAIATSGFEVVRNDDEASSGTTKRPSAAEASMLSTDDPNVTGTDIHSHGGVASSTEITITAAEIARNDNEITTLDSNPTQDSGTTSSGRDVTTEIPREEPLASTWDADYQTELSTRIAP